jgi:hypothetical protein
VTDKKQAKDTPVTNTQNKQPTSQDKTVSFAAEVIEIDPEPDKPVSDNSHEASPQRTAPKKAQPVITTRSGRHVKPNPKYRD